MVRRWEHDVPGAACSETAPTLYKPNVPKHGRHQKIPAGARVPHVLSSGSDISRRGLLQNRFVPLGFGQQFLEPGISLPRPRHPLRVIHTETSILLSPANRRPYSDTDLLHCQSLSLVPGDHHLGLAAFRDNLFRSVLLSSRHPIPTLQLCPIARMNESIPA